MRDVPKGQLKHQRVPSRTPAQPKPSLSRNQAPPREIPVQKVGEMQEASVDKGEGEELKKQLRNTQCNGKETYLPPFPKLGPT